MNIKALFTVLIFLIMSGNANAATSSLSGQIADNYSEASLMCDEPAEHFQAGINLSAIDSTKNIASSCCRICRKGKACGNSCIARNRTCHQPPGCACDG